MNGATALVQRLDAHDIEAIDGRTGEENVAVVDAEPVVVA